MSKPTSSMIAFIALLLATCVPVHAFVPNEGQQRELMGEVDPEMMGILLQPERPVEWAWVQGGPPNDAGRGPGGPRRGPQGGPAGRRFNGPMGNDHPPFPPRLLNQLRNLRP